VKFWLRLIVSIALLGFLFQLTDWREATRILVDTRPLIAGAAFALCIFGLVVSAIRWNVLIRAHAIYISNYSAARFYWIGAFFSNYLPSNIGGDVVRAIAMKRSDKLSQIAASIVVERITGLAIILLLVALSLLLRPEYYAVDGLLILVWLGVGGLTMAMFAVLFGGQQASKLLANWGDKDGSLIQRGIDKFRKLVDGVNFYSNAKGAVVTTLIGAAVFYMNMVAINYFTLAAVGARLPWFEVFLIAPLIPLVSFLPISVNAIGVAEGTFVFFYVQAGVPLDTALAAALLLRLLTMFTSLLGGIFWLKDKEVPREKS